MCVGAEIIAWLVVLNCVNLALFPRVLFMRCAGLDNCVEEPKANPVQQSLSLKITVGDRGAVTHTHPL